MRAHVLQHVPFEGLGSAGPWLEAAGYDTTCTRLFDSPVFPDPGDIDILIIMGGPMSVYDDEAFPWLVREREFIRSSIAAGIPMLGVCLGAQLIANVLGARVYPNREEEIGWFPIQAVPRGDDGAFRFPASFEAFHWHGETFDLPPGAVHLARSDACESQAFQIGRSIIGLQFHLETTAASARALVTHCAHELVPARYVQAKDEILSAPAVTYAAVNRLMAKVLAYLPSGSSG